MPADQARIEAVVAQYQGLTPPQRRAYNEANTRKDFIEPLFEALGWNVRSKEEVDAEKLVRPGFADYAFLQHGVVRFYLEAKPLDDDIYQDDYARQVITYAYSKGTAWAVLTNFARLVAFDALEQLDGGAPRRVLDLECGDYVSSLNLLTLLTPESLAGGSLTAHAERIGVRRRAIPIEKRLYESMRAWREEIFNHMATALGWGTDQQLREGDEAIQRLLDRLIFLRNCEDRGIGEPGLRALRNRLRTRGSNVRVAESLLRLFDRAASTYDSELFQTDALVDVFMRGSGTILDGTLAEVIEGLYSVPKSFAAYDFGLIDADVLGQVYEQYLGHVAQRVRQLAARPTLPGMPAPEIAVEAKRERRKQRGIYYTPKWVVDYIVRQTVGRFLEEHANDPEAIANLTILDPACGSGSFLIRAYETLLEHHARQMGGDVGHLDRKMREWVLRHNIFGVDLDPQAVEIARLNLLIRMVREEEELPPLADNIRLGNSLISGGEGELRPYFGEGWKAKEPLDWQREFPDIMGRGGFDIVIGNPPYVETSLIPAEERDYYRDHYETAHAGFDLYVLFIERALALLKDGGWFAYITSGKFLKAEYGKRLCEFLERVSVPTDLLDLSGQKEVFAGAINYPVVIVCRKGGSQRALRYTFVAHGAGAESVAALDEVIARLGYDAPARSLAQGVWPPPRGVGGNVLVKLQAEGQRLGQVAEVYRGLETCADPALILAHRDVGEGNLVRVYSHATGGEHVLESELLHPVLKGSVHMRRYHIAATNLLLLFPYYPSSYNLLPPQVMQEQYPRVWDYLNLPAVKKLLEGRDRGRWVGHPQWYGYTRRNNHDRFGTGRSRLMTPSIAPYASFSYDADGQYYFTGSGGGGGGGYAVELGERTNCSLLYLLALLNSTTLDYYLRQISSPFRGGYWAYNRQYISRLPIRVADMDNPKDRKQHDDLVALVHRMLDLHQRLAAKGEVHDNERDQIDRDIDRTDREIDDLVYDLYGLTAAERDLVEREMAR